MKAKICLLLCVIYNMGYAQSYVVTTYRDTDEKGCGDWHWEKMEVVDGNDADAKIIEYKKNRPGIQVNTVYARSGNSLIVYEYYTHMFPGACIYKKIEAIRGETLEKIRARNQELYNQYRGTYVTEPKELFLFENVKNSDLMINDTNINARFFNSDSGAITVQLSNNNTSKTIYVRIVAKHGNEEIINEEKFRLAKGANETRKIGTANSYEVLISNPIEEAENTSIDHIESIKDWVKKAISNEEINNKSAGIGVRG